MYHVEPMHGWCEDGQTENYTYMCTNVRNEWFISTENILQNYKTKKGNQQRPNWIALSLSCTNMNIPMYMHKCKFVNCGTYSKVQHRTQFTVNCWFFFLFYYRFYYKQPSMNVKYNSYYKKIVCICTYMHICTYMQQAA